MKNEAIYSRNEDVDMFLSTDLSSFSFLAATKFEYPAQNTIKTENTVSAVIGPA